MAIQDQKKHEERITGAVDDFRKIIANGELPFPKAVVIVAQLPNNRSFMQAVLGEHSDKLALLGAIEVLKNKMITGEMEC